jgi:hypothetical protein
MASFTDQISQFNPYIKQLPVEEMTKVGLYKQQKYDEGVQKVQGYIDSMAGLDIGKDIDKAYLQGKINELGSKLKTVAAGDFSNYQLVNSIGGMTTQIIKDPVIQEAVTSTKYLRKGQEDIETARKAGKSSVQNESYWSQVEVGSWLNDGKLGSSFRGRYTEYTDMEKKLREVAKEVHEYDSSIEIPFIRDTSGKTLYFYKDAQGKRVATTDPSKGTPEMDMAILKTRVKGKSAEKILDNFYTSLDENDKKQLGIDGWYHYKGFSGDQFKSKVKSDITETFQTKKKMISEEIVKLSVELATNENLTTEQKNSISTALSKYQALSKGGGLDKLYEQSLASIDKMDDMTLKQSVYTEKFLTNLADNIAYQDMETEYKNNPYHIEMMKVKDLEFKYWDAQRDQRNKDRTYGLDVIKLQLEQAKEAREAAKFYKELAGTQYTWQDLGTSTEGKTLPTLAGLDAGISDARTSMANFRNKNGAALIPGYSGKTEEQQIEAFDRLIESYTMNPKATTDNNKRLLLEEYRSMQIDYTTRMYHRDHVSKLSEEKFGTKLNDAFKGMGGAVVNGKVLYTPQEMASVITDLNNNFTTSNTYTVNGAPVKTMNVDVKAITEKYGKTKFSSLANAYIKKNKGYKLNQFENSVLNIATDVHSKTQRKVANVLAEKSRFESETIGNMMPQYQQVATSLDTQDKDTQRGIETTIGNMYALYNALGSLDVAAKAKFDPDTITEWRTGDKAKDLKYIVRKTADGSNGALIIMNGDEVQEIPLGTDLGKYFPKAVMESPMANVKNLIMGNPNKTTNVLGDRSGRSEAALNARFSGTMLPTLANTAIAPLIRFDVEGASTNTGGDKDVYQLRMYVNDNGVWKSDIVNRQGFGTYGGIMKMMNEVGTTEYLRIKNLK